MLELVHITFSCAEPERIAKFWATLLDYEVAPAGESWTAKDPRGEGTTLLFNRMAKSPTIEVPIHLDVNARDREAELARVLERGGSLVETRSFKIGELGGNHTVMRDPEGNGFCLEEAPDAERNHVWNVTFASAQPRELGRFWAFALGWPDADVNSAIIQQFRDAGVAEPDLSGFHVTKPPDGGAPRLYFHRREKSRPESYPLHLDFATEDSEAEIERLAGAGASVVETKQGTSITFTIMRDPEGNPFCVG
jgi:predicted enzyme related to lactoylglutathione lyase